MATQLMLTNSLTRRKDVFTPLDPQHIKMYVCGITPYEHSHIGHARVYVVFDVLYRLLKYRYPQVTYVRNYTDIDDKIIHRSQEQGVGYPELATQMIASYQADMSALQVLVPDVEPKVTEYIPEIIALITTLLARDIAYVTARGDVNYDVSRVPPVAGYTYGQLSGKKPAELIAGARVDVDESKRNPGDFALWKAAKPGEPNWDSPWGLGRPGWHIECSAMAKALLGDQLDIHAGGEDLQFPHHENEIAQSQGACGCQYVTYWLHNAFITVNGAKMSKSLGNFTLIRDVLRDFPGGAIRLWLLQTHYRKPVDFSIPALQAAEKQLKKLLRAADTGTAQAPQMADISEIFSPLLDDLNTAKALAVLHVWRAAANGGDGLAQAKLRSGLEFLGLWPDA